MINKNFLSISSEPILSSICKFLVESKVNDFLIFLVNILKLYLMLINGTKVLFGFLGGGGTQTFVILDFPTFEILVLSPLFILWNSKERFNLISFCCFDNGSNEFFQKSIVFHKRRPEMMNEVYEQTFNVRAIMILISHYHN